MIMVMDYEIMDLSLLSSSIMGDEDNFVLDPTRKGFDELSRKMWETPLFNNAVINWNFTPGSLYDFAFSLGYERVLEELRIVNRRPGINNRGAYLRKRLNNMLRMQTNGQITGS